jgi:large subunit ribosomal protein L3
MTRVHQPRSGTMQFWPRKRAKRIYPSVNFFSSNYNLQIPGFIGYKVGMVKVQYNDQDPNKKLKDSIVAPATIIECPPLKPLNLRFYKKTIDGLKCLGELKSKNLDKELSRKIKISKKESVEKNFENFDELRLIVYTQPKLTSLSKKKPEILEIKLNCNLEEAKQLLEKKEILLQDNFKENMYIDIHAVTKGKGLQGSIKRFGISLKQKKSEKHKRAVGNLGAWTPKHVSHTVPQPGQMGFYTRTELNKIIMKVDNSEEINPKAGFKRYGVIKNQYIIVKGSIPGPTKRTIVLTPSIRKNNETKLALKEVLK